MNMCVNGFSHTGLRRKTNEDRFFFTTQNDGSLLCMVADGMGGAPGGAEAASIAASFYETISRKEPVSPKLLSRIAVAAHQDILEHGRRHPELSGMGTTLTVCLVHGRIANWAHIGDSRLYRLHRGHLERLTTDHRFLESLIRDGDITEEDARHHPFKHMLDQCLGCPEIALECGSVALEPGDYVLACTDGLHDELNDAVIEHLLTHGEKEVPAKVEALVNAALAAGGRDNITVILAEALT